MESLNKVSYAEWRYAVCRGKICEKVTEPVGKKGK
jgi:hypothetical protein